MIPLVSLRGRAELRSRWRSMLALVIILGIGGGVALTAFAGARRTDAAVSQFQRYSLPDQGGFMYGGVTGPPVIDSYGSGLLPGERRVVDLPEVAAFYRLPDIGITTDPTRQPNPRLNVLASPDAAFFHGVDRPLMLSGRLPDPGNPSEAAVNALAAAELHLRVGSRLHLYSESHAGVDLPVRVTGIFRLLTDVSAVEPYAARQDVAYEGKQEIYVPPAFVTTLASRSGISAQRFPQMNLLGVRLHHGMADYPAFSRDALKAGGGQVFVGDPGNALGFDPSAASASQATRLQALSLLGFGVVALLITLVVAGQAVARQIILQYPDYTTLSSLGARPGQLLAAALFVPGLTALAAGLVALVVALSASPLMPIGLARQAEIHPGFHVDAAVMVGGAVALAALILLWCVPAAWRASGRPGVAPAGPSASRVVAAATALGRAVRSPAAAMGLRLGLERGHGRRAVPVLSALLAAAVAIAGLSASFTFRSSVSHLAASPAQEGWNWDALVGDPSDFGNREADYASRLAANALVGSYSAIAVIAGARQGNAYIGGVALDSFFAFDMLRGSVHPTLLEGRPPVGLHEIVLGTRTLAKLHKRVGDTVRLDVGPPKGSITLRVVGAMIAPSVGDLFTNSLGDGAWISGAAYKQAQAQKAAAGTGPGNGPGPPDSTFSLVAVRYAPGASPEAAYASLRREFGPIVLRQLPPEDVINLTSVQALPVILSGLIGVLGLATIGHTLVTSVRRRRHELAILKTMGFVRRQVLATVAWQATSFVVVALLVGIPVGVALGRWIWFVVASNLSSASPPSVPLLWLGLIVPSALGAANLVASAPGWAAARLAPSVVLRED